MIRTSSISWPYTDFRMTPRAPLIRGFTRTWIKTDECKVRLRRVVLTYLWCASFSWQFLEKVDIFLFFKHRKLSAKFKYIVWTSNLARSDVRHFELVLPYGPPQDGLEKFDSTTKRSGCDLRTVLLPRQGRDAENDFFIIWIWVAYHKRSLMSKW